MTDADRILLRARVKKAEALRLAAYTDSRGFLSIGYGRMIDARRGGGLSPEEAAYLLTNDLQRAERQCETLPVYLELSPARQAVLIELCFNMGLEGLREFKKMLHALVRQAYDEAASELLDSDMAKQVGPIRSGRLATQLKTGVWSNGSGG